MRCELEKPKHLMHDGQHILNPSKYFEWWYFDFDLKNKHHVYIEWHAPNFVSRGKMCLLVFRCYGPRLEQPIIKIFRYHRSLITQKKKKCNILFPSGHIFENNGDYFININEKNLSINLKLERILPPMVVNEEVIVRTKDNHEFFSWNIPLPKANVRGEIDIDKKPIDAEGIAYHDHNWGNLNIGKHLMGWTWLRVFFRDITFILGDITEKDSKKKTQVVLLIDDKGKKINISSLSVEYMNYLSHRRYKLSIPQKIILICSNSENCEIHFEIESNLGFQEFPLGSFENHRCNSFLSMIYYILKLNYAPKNIKRLFGQSLYFQFETKCAMYLDGRLRSSKNCKMEVFTFAN